MSLVRRKVRYDLSPSSSPPLSRTDSGQSLASSASTDSTSTQRNIPPSSLNLTVFQNIEEIGKGHMTLLSFLHILNILLN